LDKTDRAIIANDNIITNYYKEKSILFLLQKLLYNIYKIDKLWTNFNAKK